MQVVSALSFLLLATIAFGFPLELLETRQTNGTTPAFVFGNGTIDIVSLLAAAKITPTNLPPTLPTNQTLDTSNTSAIAVAQASSQNSGSSIQKRILGLSCLTTIYLPSTLGNLFVPQGLSYSTFLAWPYFSSTAKAANATVLSGNYTKVYQNLQATYSNPGANAYLGMSTQFSYNPQVCASRCNSIKGCLSFEVS
jgi:hypothetical protein